MKRGLFIFSVLILMFCTSMGQKKKEYIHVDPLGFKHIDTTVNSNYVPCLIERDGYKPLLVRFSIVGKQDFTYMGLYKPTSEALRLYGKEHIILIKLKRGIELLNLEQIFALYNLPRSYKSLPIFVDKMQIIPSETILGVKSDIDSVNIVTNPENGQKMISIITNN
jgi:hypothetical protein